MILVVYCQLVKLVVIWLWLKVASISQPAHFASLSQISILLWHMPQSHCQWDTLVPSWCQPSRHWVGATLCSMHSIYHNSLSHWPGGHSNFTPGWPGVSGFWSGLTRGLSQNSPGSGFLIQVFFWIGLKIHQVPGFSKLWLGLIGC